MVILIKCIIFFFIILVILIKNIRIIQTPMASRIKKLNLKIHLNINFIMILN